MEAQNWQRSSVAARHRYGVGMKRIPARASETSFARSWSSGARQIILQVQHLLHRDYRISIPKLEEWQVTRYGEGEFFDFHLDCGCWRDDPAGERKRTIMICLDAPVSGGDTFFRALNLRIVPEAGKLLIWNNLLPNGHCDHAMVHAGLPVLKGTKTVLVTWERQKPIAFGAISADIAAMHVSSVKLPLELKERPEIT